MKMFLSALFGMLLTSSVFAHPNNGGHGGHTPGHTPNHTPNHNHTPNNHTPNHPGHHNLGDPKHHDHQGKPGDKHVHNGKQGHPVAPVHLARHNEKNYHVKHGKSFTHNGKKSWAYKGWNHNHWSANRWDARYGCYLYYDSGLSCWYYWCQPRFCYYPVDYNPCGYAFDVPTDDDGCPQPDDGYDDDADYEVE